MQTVPPLPLTISRLLTLPATNGDAVLYATLDIRNSGTKAFPVAMGFQTMDGFAAGTTQTTQENSFSKGSKIGEYKTVPPEGLLAARATGGLYPREVSAKTSNLVDVGSNMKYQ